MPPNKVAAFAIVLVLAAGCTPDKAQRPPTTAGRPSAAPGQVVTIAGTGQDGTNRGVALTSGINRPLALDMTKNGDLIYLSASQSTAINRINPHGVTSAYPSESSRTRLANVIGMPHSSLLLPDGRYITLNWIGELSEILPDGNGRPLGSLAQQMGTEKGELARQDEGKPLIIAGGRLYELFLDAQPKITAMKLPGTIDQKVTLATAGKGGELLIGTEEAVFKIHNKSIAQEWVLNRTLSDRSTPTVLISDGDGGAWVGTSSGRLGRIEHLKKDGKSTTVLTGSADPCTTVPSPGSREKKFPVEYPLNHPSALLISNHQLYVADRECSRITAIGLPLGQ